MDALAADQIRYSLLETTCKDDRGTLHRCKATSQDYRVWHEQEHTRDHPRLLPLDISHFSWYWQFIVRTARRDQLLSVRVPWHQQQYHGLLRLDQLVHLSSC